MWYPKRGPISDILRVIQACRTPREHGGQRLASEIRRVQRTSSPLYHSVHHKFRMDCRGNGPETARWETSIWYFFVRMVRWLFSELVLTAVVIVYCWLMKWPRLRNKIFLVERGFGNDRYLIKQIPLQMRLRSKEFFGLLGDFTRLPYCFRNKF